MTVPPEAITQSLITVDGVICCPECFQNIASDNGKHGIQHDADCAFMAAVREQGAAAERDRISTPEVTEDGSRFCRVCGADLLDGDPA